MMPLDVPDGGVDDLRETGELGGIEREPFPVQSLGCVLPMHARLDEIEAERDRHPVAQLGP